METLSYARLAGAGRARRWWKLLIPALLVVVAAAVVGVVALLPANTAAPAAVAIPPVNVKVLVVQPIPELADTLDLTAVVEPNRVVRVAAEVPGQIERYGRRSQALHWSGRAIAAGTVIEEGEPVLQGEPLVHLNQDLLQSRHDRAQAQFDFDEREYQRILALYESGGGATSKTELEDVRTRREISRATLAEATRELERTTIVAPLSGILNRLLKEVGEYVSPGDEVAEIVDLETVKVSADVPERDTQYFQVGGRAEVWAHASEDSPLAGEITYLSALADEGTRTTRLEITLNNRERVLRSGQIVRARLTRRVLPNVLMIPLEAVIPLEEGKAVYVVQDGRAERRDIALGFVKGRAVRVLSGLAAGDRLIVAGHRYVGSGQPVNVVEEASGAGTRPVAP